MGESTSAWVGPWSRWAAGSAGVLRAARDSAERAARLAGLLAEVAPPGSAVGCLLGPDSGVEGEGLPTDLRSATPDPGETRQVDHRTRTLVTAGFAVPGGQSGALFLLPPGGTGPEVAGGLEVLLGLAAALLGEQLRGEAAQQERRELDELAVAGEAALGMTHALNNHLNSMILQAMAVQVRLSEPLRGELANVRREGMLAAGQLRPLQALRDQIEAGRDQDVAVASVLSSLQKEEPALAARVAVQLPDPALRVPLPLLHLRRLLLLLLHVVQGAHSGSKPAPLTFLRVENALCLRLELDGPDVAGGTTKKLIELQLPMTSGMLELQLAAAQGLARRLGGQIEVRNRPGGASIEIRWETGPEAQAAVD